MRVVIFGMGKLMQDYINKKCLYKNDDIIAFVDNNSLLWGKSFCNIPILNPIELCRLEYDQVIICAFDENNIKHQLINELKVTPCKIKTIREIERYYTAKVISKYKSVKNIEIQNVISYFEKNGVVTFGEYSPNLTDYEIYRDEENHPYIIFEGKRIYYPDTYHLFFKRDGKEYLPDVMYEQKKNSPHLYVEDENSILPGSVVVDAGACEGNFGIRFIEKVSRLYLIESDPIWIECLKRTFYPFKEKVVICNKKLARYDSSRTITLDSLIKKEKVDFLKMDIEGDEIDALLGAQETLKNNDLCCSICAYHRMNDEKNIKFILENLGYNTSVSNGYMFFWYDDNILDTLDIRKGIVYAKKH